MPRIDVIAEGSSVNTDQGLLAFCSVILIEGERRVLFDSAHVGRRTFIEAQLQARGLRPEDIDLQVLSHAHWDHVQNCDLFSRAPVLIHHAERRYAQRPHRNDWATPRWTGAMIETFPLVEVGEGYEVMPGVRVIELVGHSPGSIGLEVETDDGLCVLTGDAIHSAAVARSGRNPLVFWDADRADAAIKRCVDSGAWIYPGHDRPFRLQGGEIEYRYGFQMTMAGIGPGTPGARFVENPPPREVWVMPGAEESRRLLMD